MTAESAVPGVAEGTAAAAPEPEASLGSLLAPEGLGIWTWVLGYTAILSTLSILRYRLWLSTGFDLGLYEQGLWLIMHHGLLAATTYTHQPILARDESWILVALAPLYAVGGVGFLLVLQSFALGLGYLFIRRIAQALGVPNGAAHLVGAIYLLYPVVISANLFDFHPNTLATTLLFGLVWAALVRRWRIYAVLLALSLLAQNHVALPVAVLALVLAARRDFLWAAVTLASAVLVARLDLHAALPYLTGTAGSTWSAVVPGALSPFASAHVAFAWIRSPRDWEYLAFLVGPVAALAWLGGGALLNPWWLPGLAVAYGNLLSPEAAATSPFSALSVLAVPFVFAGCLMALRGRALVRGRARLTLAVPAAAVLAFVWFQWHLGALTPPPNATALAAAVSKIPPRVPLVTQNFTASTLSNRTHVWLTRATVPSTLPAGTYVLLDNRYPPRVSASSTTKRLEAALARLPTAAHEYSHHGVRLYRLRHRLTL